MTAAAPFATTAAMSLAVIPIDHLALSFEPWRWPFAEARRAEIDAHFAARRAQRPHMWNGRVLLASRYRVADGRLAGACFETDFASFLAWRDWGFPDAGAFNCFAMGALRSRDGAFLLGVMGPHTANAGRIYFPCGTPDPDDVRDGAVDVAGSVAREIFEETGLAEKDYAAEPHWDCVVVGAAIAMIRLLNVDMRGKALRARIEAALARQHQPELSAIHLVRRTDDFTAAMPRFVTAFLEARLSS